MKPSWRIFFRKIKDVQQEKLLTLLEQQAETEYGKNMTLRALRG